MDHGKGYYEPDFVETNDSFLSGSIKWGLDAVTVLTGAQGSPATGLLAKTPAKGALSNQIKDEIDGVVEIVNGSSKLSTKAQHNYNILDTCFDVRIKQE